MKKVKTDGYTPALLVALGSGNLGNILAAGMPGGIEAQEALGQQSISGTALRLPKNITTRGVYPANLSRAWGVKFGVEVDDIFVQVTFPEGWNIEPTDHSMWSDLIAPDGSKRASIFYKAAFYDRSAYLSILPRYSVWMKYGDHSDPDAVNSVFIKDNKADTVLVHIGVHGTKDYDAGDQMVAEARKWLSNQYPDYTNPLAYWDDK